jgi:hydrogenase-1 operon protein HyaF
MSEAANQKLKAISVRTEMSSGNLPLLMHEIGHALDALMTSGTKSIIDLQGIPLAPGEQDSIIAALGSGEVSAELQCLGRSVVSETQYPGVWIVTHYDETGDLKTRFIEITTMPQILESQPADIDDGLARLKLALERMRNSAPTATHKPI